MENDFDVVGWMTAVTDLWKNIGGGVAVRQEGGGAAGTNM